MLNRCAFFAVGFLLVSSIHSANAESLHPDVMSIDTQFQIAEQMNQMVLGIAHDCGALVEQGFPADMSKRKDHIQRTKMTCDFFSQQLDGIIKGTAAFSTIKQNTVAEENISLWRNGSGSAENLKKASQAEAVANGYMVKFMDLAQKCMSILGAYSGWLTRASVY